MERTLAVMEEELKIVQSGFDTLRQKKEALENEIRKYKLDNELYHPMSELINYLGKDISYIVVVERNEDGTLDTDYLCDDEIFEVNEYGQLYYSSYSGGIIEYDNDAHKYVHLYYGRPEYHDYVGYLEIKFREW